MSLAVPQVQRNWEKMDFFTKEQRSKCMSHIKAKDTNPELVVRRTAHAMGYRFRLHRRDLPGTPDLVFPSRQKVIFVHGCFWHRHKGCRLASEPKSRREYWLPKFERTLQRDCEALASLRNQGWQCLVVWECETQNQEMLSKRLLSFLG